METENLTTNGSKSELLNKPTRQPKAIMQTKKASIDLAAEDTPRGKTFISDEVVSTVARLAAEQIDGVHQIGETGFRGMIGRLGRNAGVDSEVGQREAAISLDIVVEFGYPILEVASALRDHIIKTVEHMAGRDVISVDIRVVDIFIPKTESPQKRLVD